MQAAVISGCWERSQPAAPRQILHGRQRRLVLPARHVGCAQSRASWAAEQTRRAQLMSWASRQCMQAARLHAGHLTWSSLCSLPSLRQEAQHITSCCAAPHLWRGEEAQWGSQGGGCGRSLQALTEGGGSARPSSCQGSAIRRPRNLSSCAPSRRRSCAPPAATSVWAALPGRPGRTAMPWPPCQAGTAEALSWLPGTGQGP